MSKKILIFITVLFFSAILFLSLFAERLHNETLPRVSVSRPEIYTFEETYTDENGETYTFCTDKTAISQKQLEKDVYVIYSAERNGTKRSFVRLVQVVTGAEKDGYLEIISGINYGERIVVNSTKELYDGAEVIVE